MPIRKVILTALSFCLRVLSVFLFRINPPKTIEKLYGRSLIAPTVLVFLLWAASARASYLPVTGSNIGIGTSTPVGGLVVMNGNVGIGTWSPTQKLQVAGTVVATAFAGDGSALVNLPTSGWTDGGPNIYNSTTTDNVGIGTTTPYSKLTVSGGQTIGAGFNTTIAPANGLIVQGNVGLGTLEPQDKVQIAGTSGTVLRLTSTNVSTYPEINMYGRPNASGEILGSMGYYIDSFDILFAKTKALREGNNAASFTFELADSATSAVAERMRINGDGNLGIGTFKTNGGLSVMTGNVGIGTWAPHSGLELKGSNASIISTGGTNTNATAAGELYVQGDLEVDGTIYGDGSGLTGASLITAAGGWTDAGANVYTTTTTDNVGVGTTTPSTTFEIVTQGTNKPLMISSIPTGDGDLFVVEANGNVGIGSINPIDFTINKTIRGKSDLIAEGNSIFFGYGEFRGNQNQSGASYAAGGAAAGDVKLGMLANATTMTANNSAAGLFVNGAYTTAAAGTHPLVASAVIAPMTINSGGAPVTNAATLYVADQMSVSTLGGNYSFWVDIGPSRFDGNVGIGTANTVAALAVMSGNVGIGTFAPVGQLEVRGGAGSTRIWTGSGTVNQALSGGELYVEGDLEVDGTIYGDGSGLTNMAALSGGWTDGGPNIYTTSTTDSVGIGTTTPNAATLEIVKNAAQAPLRISTAATGGGDMLNVSSEGRVGIGTSLNSLGMGLSVMNGNVGIGTWNTQDFASTLLTINGYSNPYVTNNPALLTLQSTNPQAANMGGGIYFSGNYTNSELKTSFAYIGGVKENGTTNNTAGRLIFGTRTASSPYTDYTRMVIDSLGNVGIGTVNPVGGLTVMTGNVGIGTWSPSSALEVKQGNASIISTGGTNTNATGPGELYVQGDLEVDGTIYGDGSGLTGTSQLTAAGGWTDGGTNVYTSTTTDNVGVGTTTPSSTVEIVKTAAGAAPLMVSRTATSDGDILIVGSSGSVGIGTTLMPPTTQLAVFGGNVGIGTWSPNYSLETTGTFAAGGANGWTLISNTWRPNINGFIGLDSANSRTFSVVNSGGTITYFHVNSVNGSVGIGTTLASPATGLAVMNGNVGIGTWSPNNGLEVKGVNAAVISTGGSNTNATGPGELYVQGDLEVDGTLYGDGSGLTGISGLSQAGGWNDGGTNIYLTTTTDNVGIGTTTPATATTLEIVKNGASQAPLKVSSTATGAGDFLTINSAGSIGVGTTLMPSTAALSVMTGNVGIGTWSPSGKMVVMGGNVGIGVAVPSTALQVGSISAATPPSQLFFGNASNSIGYPQIIGNWTSAGYWGMGPATAGTDNTLRIGSVGNVASAWAAGDATNLVVSGNIGVGTFNPGGMTARLYVGGNVGVGTMAPVAGLSVMSGNVGIGTWSPSSSLEVKGGRMEILSGGAYTNTNAAGSGELYVQGDLEVDGTIYGDGSGLTGTSQLTAAGGWTDGGANVYTSTTTDNVGVGTTTPTSTFEVVKTAAGTAPLMVSSVATGDGNIMIVTSGGNVGISTTADAAGLAVMNGNVGIGTWSPVSSLQVVGNVSVGSGAGYKQLAPGADGMIVQGNVGIGTFTLRTAALSLGGHLHMSYSSTRSISMRNSSDTGDVTWMTTSGSGTVVQVGGGNQNAIDIYSHTTFISRFMHNGTYGARVGIGTTTLAGSRLGVLGNAAIGSTNYIATVPDADNGLVVEGNTGIGTFNPASLLEVRGGKVSIISTGGTNTNATGPGELYVQGDLEVDGTIYGDGAGITGGTISNAGGWTDGGTNVYTSTTTDNVGIGTTTPNGTTFEIVKNANQPALKISSTATSDGNYMVIMSGGNVGMGTVSPIFSLQVNGNILAGPTDAGGSRLSTLGLLVNGGSAVTLRSTTLDINNTSSSRSLAMFSGGDQTVPKVMLDTAGNFGISTSDPLSRFVVTGGGIGIGTHANTSFIRTAAPAGGLAAEGRVSIGTVLSTSATGLTVMNGNVGIGTWSARSGIEVGTGGTIDNATGVNDVYVKGKVEADGGFFGDGSGLTNVANTAGWTDGGTNVYTTTTTDNVGIGTTTPTSTLEVVKTAAGTAPLMVSSVATADGDLLIVKSAGSVGIGTTLSSPPAALTVMNGNVGIGTWSNPVNSISIADGNIGIGTYLAYRRIAGPNNGMVMEGNLGVGTWNPTTKVQVVGTVTATAFAGDGSGLTNVANTAGWTDGGTNVYTSTTTDNVGIGTTTPNAATLEIVKNAAQPLLKISGTATSSGDFLTVTSAGALGVGTTLATSTTSIVLMSGNVGIGTWSSPGDRLYIADGNIGIGTYLAYRRIAGPNNGMVMEGNLGVGTWNPTTKVQVVGTVTATAFAGDGSALTNISGGWTDGGTNVYTSATTDNVGIGTTTPSTTFEIVKQSTNTLFMASSVATGDGDFFMIDSRGGVGIGTTRTSPSTGLAIMNGNVGIGTWSPTSRFQVAGSGDSYFTGNVGVGTATPSTNLHVQGNARITGLVSCDTIDTDANGNLVCGTDTGGGATGWTDGGTNVYVSTTSDNVGIGTTTPSSTLEVVKTAAATAPLMVSSTPTADGDVFIVNSSGSVGIGTVLSPPTTGLAVFAGNVGVGTWSPRTQFEVRNTVGYGQVTIDGSSGACLMFRDTDNGGWTECNALDGALTCSFDADGICDGS